VPHADDTTPHARAVQDEAKARAAIDELRAVFASHRGWLNRASHAQVLRLCKAIAAAVPDAQDLAVKAEIIMALAAILYRPDAPRDGTEPRAPGGVQVHLRCLEMCNALDAEVTRWFQPRL
jgi:hypothetical protein